MIYYAIQTNRPDAQRSDGTFVDIFRPFINVLLFLFQACGDFTTYGPKYDEFLQKVKFFRCAQKAKIGACLRYDLNRNKDLFDLTALAEIGEFDDTTKMMLIMAQYATSDKTGLFDYQ